MAPSRGGHADLLHRSNCSDPVHFSIVPCHPRDETMPIESVSFQLQRMTQARIDDDDDDGDDDGDDGDGDSDDADDGVVVVIKLRVRVANKII